jgi:hypothetical protein
MNEEIKKRQEADFKRELKICLDWLNDKPRTKNINNDVTTLRIKQTIERELKTYVSRDAVMEAVKIMEIPFKHDPEFNNIVYLALSSRILGFREMMLQQKRDSLWPKVQSR